MGGFLGFNHDLFQGFRSIFFQQIIGRFFLNHHFCWVQNLRNLCRARNTTNLVEGQRPHLSFIPVMFCLGLCQVTAILRRKAWSPSCSKRWNRLATGFFKETFPMFSESSCLKTPKGSKLEIFAPQFLGAQDFINPQGWNNGHVVTAIRKHVLCLTFGCVDLKDLFKGFS